MTCPCLSAILLLPQTLTQRSRRSFGTFSKSRIALARNGKLFQVDQITTDDLIFSIVCSAIYCTSGPQAAQRAAQGFDMVGFRAGPVELRETYRCGFVFVDQRDSRLSSHDTEFG